MCQKALLLPCFADKILIFTFHEFRYVFMLFFVKRNFTGVPQAAKRKRDFRKNYAFLLDVKTWIDFWKADFERKFYLFCLTTNCIEIIEGEK